jgi:hypothetical protein
MARGGHLLIAPLIRHWVSMIEKHKMGAVGAVLELVADETHAIGSMTAAIPLVA